MATDQNLKSALREAGSQNKHKNVRFNEKVMVVGGGTEPLKNESSKKIVESPIRKGILDAESLAEVKLYVTQNQERLLQQVVGPIESKAKVAKIKEVAQGHKYINHIIGSASSPMEGLEALEQSLETGRIQEPFKEAIRLILANNEESITDDMKTYRKLVEGINQELNNDVKKAEFVFFQDKGNALAQRVSKAETGDEVTEIMKYAVEERCVTESLYSQYLSAFYKFNIETLAEVATENFLTPRSLNNKDSQVPKVLKAQLHPPKENGKEAQYYNVLKASLSLYNFNNNSLPRDEYMKLFTKGVMEYGGMEYSKGYDAGMAILNSVGSLDTLGGKDRLAAMFLVKAAGEAKAKVAYIAQQKADNPGIMSDQEVQWFISKVALTSETTNVRLADLYRSTTKARRETLIQSRYGQQMLRAFKGEGTPLETVELKIAMHREGMGVIKGYYSRLQGRRKAEIFFPGMLLGGYYLCREAILRIQQGAAVSNIPVLRQIVIFATGLLETIPLILGGLYGVCRKVFFLNQSDECKLTQEDKDQAPILLAFSRDTEQYELGGYGSNSFRVIGNAITMHVSRLFTFSTQKTSTTEETPQSFPHVAARDLDIHSTSCATPGPSLTGVALLQEKARNDKQYMTLLNTFDQAFANLVSGYDNDDPQLTADEENSRKEQLLELVFFHRSKTTKDEKSIQHPSPGSVLCKTNAALSSPTEPNLYKGNTFQGTIDKINQLKDNKVLEWKEEKAAGRKAAL
ncbi:MAG: hypothetical protein VXW87_04135 [Pseudomonadota bacterium]|nr:hypothetical protein [Pseudomonadota bacterium]